MQVNPQDVTAIDKPLAVRVEAAAMDEQWSFGGSKANQRWLWFAIDHATNRVLAYVFGRRTDEVFKELKALLEPFNVVRYFTDDWGAYERHLAPDSHEVGKRNTQRATGKLCGG